MSRINKTLKRWTVNEIYKLLVHVKTQYEGDIDVIDTFISRPIDSLFGGGGTEPFPNAWIIADELGRTEGAVTTCWRRVVDWGMFQFDEETPTSNVYKEAFKKFDVFEKEYKAKFKKEEEEKKAANIKSRYNLDDYVHFAVEGMNTRLLIGKIVRITHVVENNSSNKKLCISYDVEVLTKYDIYNKNKEYTVFKDIDENSVGFEHKSALKRKYMIARQDGLGIVAFHNTDTYPLEVAICLINQNRDKWNDRVLLEVFRDAESWTNPALAKPDDISILSIKNIF